MLCGSPGPMTYQRSVCGRSVLGHPWLSVGSSLVPGSLGWVKRWVKDPCRVTSCIFCEASDISAKS